MPELCCDGFRNHGVVFYDSLYLSPSDNYLIPQVDTIMKIVATTGIFIALLMPQLAFCPVFSGGVSGGSNAPGLIDTEGHPFRLPRGLQSDLPTK